MRQSVWLQSVTIFLAALGAVPNATGSMAPGQVIITRTGKESGPPSFRFQESDSKQPALVYAIHVSVADETRKVVCIVRRKKTGEILPFEELWRYGTVPPGFESPMCSPLEPGVTYIVSAMGVRQGSLSFSIKVKRSKSENPPRILNPSPAKKASGGTGGGTRAAPGVGGAKTVESHPMRDPKEPSKRD